MKLLGSSLVSEISKAGIGGLTFLLLAAWLGPAHYGQYVQIAAITAILMPVCTLGFNWWAQPLAREMGIRTVTLAGISVLLICIPISGPFMLGLALLFELPISTVVIVAIAELAVFPIWTFISLGLLAEKRAVAYVLVSISIPFTKLVGTLAAVLMFDASIDKWGLTVSLMGVFGLLVTVVLLGITPWFGSRKLLTNWIRQGVSFGLVGTASALADNVDKVTIATVLTPSLVGSYGVSSRLVGYGAIPVKSAAVVVYSDYFSLAAEKNIAGMRRLARYAITRSLLMSLASMIVVIFMSWVLETWFLKEFDQLFLVSTLLSISIPIRSVQYAYGDILYALGRPYSRLLIALLTACFSAIGTLVGGLLLELPGVALGAVLAAIASATTYFFFTRRLLRILEQER